MSYRVVEDMDATSRRENVFDVLQQHGPMTCKAIVPLIPASQRVVEYDCPYPQAHDQATECIHARTVFTWKPAYSNIYADLRLLEDADRVMREPDSRPVLWKIWSGVDEEARAIRSIMEALY